MITLNKLQRLSSLQAARLGVIKLAASRVCTPAPLCAEEPVEADISRLLLIGAVGAAAVGTGSWLLRPRAEVLSDRIYPRDWRYVCEGQRFLLCAPKGTDKLRDWGRWGGYVLQLRKSPGASSNAMEKLDTTNSLDGQVGVQRMLSMAIPRLFLSIPEIVSVPGADVRALDAHLLAARPQNQRRQRLDVHEEPGRVAKVLLLRKENLLDAWAPSLSLELSPGCGVKEIDGMPSRHSMAFQLANGKAEQDWNLTLFSKNSAECAGAISKSVLDPSCNGCEVFGSGGRHIGHTNVSTRDELLQSLGLSLEEVAEAGAAILSSQDSVLDSLRRLQVFAAGNAERLAGQMLVELRKHRNESPDGPDVLLQTQHFQAALAALAKSPRRALRPSSTA
ncbi:unnamed protein product [Symbiodinium natans]|uniref:Inositol-pentakisphosphate 2-kinase n=1 Tax=Symbiodinium natans TaxID=878477 RepID=A0A812H6R3_9DINO|nr:unnamed protein product [Symbiodinium natans]